MKRTALVLASTTTLLVLGSAGGASASPGGCQAFGANVASLGQALGSEFGATASGVASSAPGAFPALVVFPEQAELCP